MFNIEFSTNRFVFLKDEYSKWCFIDEEIVVSRYHIFTMTKTNGCTSILLTTLSYQQQLFHRFSHTEKGR